MSLIENSVSDTGHLANSIGKTVEAVVVTLGKDSKRASTSNSWFPKSELSLVSIVTREVVSSKAMTP